MRRRRRVWGGPPEAAGHTGAALAFHHPARSADGTQSGVLPGELREALLGGIIQRDVVLGMEGGARS